MKIDPTKIYTNRTKNFLLPVVKVYGKIFLHNISTVFKISVGIDDYKLRQEGYRFDNHLFFLINTVSSRKHFISALDWFRTQNMYAFDYPFDNPVSGYMHMIVFIIPEEYRNAYKHFVGGNYSKMYTKGQIKALFGENSDKEKIFNPNRKTKEEFAELVNKDFDTDLTVNDFEEIKPFEVEYPFKRVEEIFNYPKELL